MQKPSLLIIGAGATGLMAANELAETFSITILEARSHLGGRIRTIPSANHPIEAGAEFIHGDLPVTTSLLKQAGITPVPAGGNFYRKEKGQLTIQEDMIEGWDELLKEMKKVKVDVSLQDFLDEYYGQPEQAEIRKHAIAFAEGFDVADTSKASVKALYREWSSEPENQRTPSGYSALVEYLHGECEKKGVIILTNHLVKQIDWEKGDVTVYADGEIYRADKVIVTIPIGILQKTGDTASINFTPPLDRYISAAQQIGFGAVIKVVVLFRERFWKEDMGFVLSDEIIPTWWSQLPNTIPLLTGWCGGPKAGQISGDSDEEILQKALASLSSIFNKSIDELKAAVVESHVFNWQKDPYSRGAYHYSMVTSEEARKILNTPIDDTVFFAGEALYSGKAPGTVEAALASGKEIAKKLL